MSAFRCICALSCLLATTLPIAAQEKPGDTAKAIESIRSKHELPAIGCIVIKDGKVVDRGVVGVRKEGEKTPVAIADQFHIGSCTKSMTATLAGIFIDQGKLRWDSTIAEVLPELKGKMHKDYEAVTVEQLLQNRGGLPTNPPSAAWLRAWAEKGTVVEQRRDLIIAALAENPKAKPGSKMIYSNQGYTVVGAMLEKIEGKPWEEIITERLFKPLQMKSAGFGFPGKRDKLDQPWGHTSSGKTNKPAQSDNPPAIGPAGRVHCSLDDFAKYVQLHLGASTAPKLLKPETLKRLHTPPGDEDYAAGWIVVDRPWAGGRALTHNGSNTMWFAVMWLAPNKQFAVISATNVGGDAAESACDDVAAAMIGKWLK